MAEHDHEIQADEKEFMPPGRFHYAMHRVLGPAMGVVIFLVMLVAFPILIAGGAPPFSILHLIGLFGLASAGFWAWAQHVDNRGSDHES